MIKFKNFNVNGSDYRDPLSKGFDELEKYINEFLVDRSITKNQILDVKTNYSISDGDYYNNGYYDIDTLLTYWLD